MVLYVRRDRRATIVDSVATLPNMRIVMNDPGYRQAFFLLQQKKLIRNVIKMFNYLNFNIFLTVSQKPDFRISALKMNERLQGTTSL